MIGAANILTTSTRTVPGPPFLWMQGLACETTQNGLWDQWRRVTKCHTIWKRGHCKLIHTCSCHCCIFTVSEVAISQLRVEKESREDGLCCFKIANTSGKTFFPRLRSVNSTHVGSCLVRMMTRCFSVVCWPLLTTSHCNYTAVMGRACHKECASGKGAMPEWVLKFQKAQELHSLRTNSLDWFRPLYM